MDYYQIFAIIGALVVVIVALGILIFVLIRKKKKNKKKEEFPELLVALGGKENISEITQKGSRVSVIVDNKKSVNKEKLKEEGVETIVVSNKKITMVVGNKKAQLIYNYFNNIESE